MSPRKKTGSTVSAAIKRVAPSKAVRIATVSHTLEVKLSERLREFAFRQRVSESAVIEHALREFFEEGTDLELGSALRKAGATLRRRV